MNYIEEELLRQARFWSLLTGDGADRREEGQPSERTAESAAETERAAESAARLREFPGLSAGNRRYAQPQSGGAERYARAGADPEPAGAQAASPEMPDGAAQAGSAVSLRRAAGELSECVERDARRYDGAYPLY